MNMADVAQVKKKMLLLAVASAVILIAATAATALGYSSLKDSGLVIYMMAVPIILTVLAFVFGYLDVNEKMKDDDIEYIIHRTYIFGGILFFITILVLVALYMS